MPEQLETREPDFSQRAIAALTALADLSLRTSTLRFSPPEVLDQLAALLVRQLVTVCEASQGALFLVRPGDDASATQPRDAFVTQSSIPLIACSHMSEEEARAALAIYPSASAPQQWSLDLPPTLVWRRSLDEPLAKVLYPNPLISHLAPQSYALLLLTWPETSQYTREQPLQARERAIHLLSVLANAIDTILLHLFVALSEQRKHNNELFPAEVLATVGHEFRGPLTTIQGYAMTLLRHDQQLARGERQDFLNAISEASMHLGKLVDRFLELSQFEANTFPFVPAAVNIVALAHEAINAVKKGRPHPFMLMPPLMESGEVLAEATFSEEFTVSGDRRWLRTMLDILLENAVIYSSPESLIEVNIASFDPAHLRAALGVHARPDSHVALILPMTFQEDDAPLEIQVRDHGMGIPPEHLSRIFQRFYRIDTRLTRDVNGLGLGLALCKAIVALHRGMLWVESIPGEGSTFHILLPRRAPVEQP